LLRGQGGGLRCWGVSGGGEMARKRNEIQGGLATAVRGVSIRGRLYADEHIFLGDKWQKAQDFPYYDLPKAKYREPW